MHASSLENMHKCYRKYIAGQPLESSNSLKVLDIGGANVNGSYADVFCAENVDYVGVDLQEGEGITIVLDDPYKLPLPDESVDIVLSGQMLEHCERFWLVFDEMVRVLKTDGWIFLIAPSAGPIHSYPVDCYRFYPDAYRSLAKFSACYLIDVWKDDRGPWKDLVGVFNKTGVKPESKYLVDDTLARSVNAAAGFPATAFEKISGETPYLEVLETIHRTFEPDRYLEIGVRHGRSLHLARGTAAGVDPSPDLKVTLPEATRLIVQTSDEFFEQGSDPILKAKPDLVFIDGMHLCENVLRDFMNVERFSKPGTIVVLDDVFPNLPEQATRHRNTRVWCGDVWKFYGCLKQFRPDLTLIPLDTSPTGLLLIAGLDSGNRVLWDRYNPIVRKFNSQSCDPPIEILKRQSAIKPSSETFKSCLEEIDQWRNNMGKQETSPECLKQQIERLMDPKPKLSVVVICYNMARELPRTLLSLSPKFQNGIKSTDYEIIVVDNGSTKPFDENQCRAICPNIRFICETSKSKSPVAAINTGISQAKGQLVGVMIDGARLVSPGMLAAALAGSRTSARAVIGTCAFHLGSETQMESVKTGYNQRVEDELLSTVPWQREGYSLFSISVFAGSSLGGWFNLPSESNALFMRKELWQELGGYDQKFKQPGGGLANLDVWKRACELHNVSVIMLLGEATFHQFHNGIATNSVISFWKSFAAEYASIRGVEYSKPSVEVTYFGKLRDLHL